MADDTDTVKPEAVNAALGDMKLEEGGDGRPSGSNGSEAVKRSPSGTPGPSNAWSQSPAMKQSASQTPKSEDDDREIIGADITVTAQPGKAPKLIRKATQKVESHTPALFLDVDDATEEACSVFTKIKDCIYGSKHLGSTDNDVLDCDCAQEWSDGTNHACGEDSDCINRATKMECVDGNNCGRECQNQRFQRKQYANVSVIKTEKKGYGLRANADLHAHDFIFEYIGEVINEPTFRRRTIQYDEEGIKHFYFMSLSKGEFVDATKKGNLGRFCNHSCNPNCYVDKWVVGDKLRMGIFAERPIKAGEELVFNYNVDRYGADPQPCYCAEPNCTGFIGGKTQTERATKLSHATIEALGIDDNDGWDLAVAKKPRKKKTGEDDEEYVNNVQPKGLDERGVQKVMATLLQCKEKWIAVKLLNRIQQCNDDRIRNKVIQMHGYQILRTTLSTWKEDNNVVLQIFDILYKFPRLTKNKIIDSKIEASVQTFIDSEHEDVAFEATRLITEWNKLETAYRIPRKKYDPNAQPAYERRAPERIEEAPSPAPTVTAPSGPRNNIPHRAYISRPPPRRNFPGGLPPGWFAATDPHGTPYYYSKSGHNTWVRPTLPAVEPPPPPPPRAPPKSVQNAKALQDIINEITKATPATQTPTQPTQTPTATPTKEKKKPVEKWRSMPQEKQMKLYENTLFPHIKYIMQKFSSKLPKDDLKKFAKEVGKKLVASDFKNNRVEDPTKISEKQEKKVKKYVRDYFEKAVEKKKVLDKQKAEKKARIQAYANGITNGSKRDDAPVNGYSTKPDLDLDDPEPETLDSKPSSPTPTSSPFPPVDSPTDSLLNPTDTPSFGDATNKRKRSSENSPEDDECSEISKRMKESPLEENEASTPPAPPPPPPPPADGMPPLDMDADVESIDAEGVEIVEETEEQKELRRQEEDLMRENEEAMLMDMNGSLKTEEKLHDLHVGSNGLGEETKMGCRGQKERF